MQHHILEREIGGRTLRIETGKIGKLAAGTVIVTYGETVVLASAVTGPARPGLDFFPMTADYREKTYAAGKFPGGFFKREARPTQKEILTMRMIDRPIRPLFPKDFRDEVLLQTMVLAVDQVNDPDILAMIGASAAICVSQLPFNGPIAACRVGLVDDKLVLNPTMAEMEFSTMEMVLAGHADGVNMIEVGAMEVSEEIVAEGIAFGQKAVAEICAMISELKEKVGKAVEWTPPEPRDDLAKAVRSKFGASLRSAREIPGKSDRRTAIKKVQEEAKLEFCPAGQEGSEAEWNAVKEILQGIEKNIVSEMIVNEDKRSDGRCSTDLRKIECEVQVLPRVHGSSLFQRGETQALCITTLGTGRDEQVVDGLSDEYSKKFMLHYNFPPMCVGEVRRLGATSRREIGHGNLAEKALEAILPTPDEFPYTIRLVSEIMESNGSSSMASVCSGCLALMDAGVPIKQPVAGISIGMVRADGKQKLIVDILGEEDFLGLMDFKVAGTQRGITAVQLDLKAHSIDMDTVKETLELARITRRDILKTMLATLRSPRPNTSEHAPRILKIQISPEKIGKVIGPGGKFIKSIEAETGAKVEIDNDGTILVATMDQASGERAIEMIESVTAEVKIGKIYTGRVSGIKDFGAFIEVVPGQDGLCHISELDDGYVKSVEDVVKIGDVVRVKVIQIDDQGRIKLSRKAAAVEDHEGAAETADASA